MWTPDDIRILTNEVGALTKINKLTKINNELQKEIKNKRRLNEELTKDLSFLTTENLTLRKGLAECCDRL